jgi:hypothetical protein
MRAGQAGSDPSSEAGGATTTGTEEGGTMRPVFIAWAVAAGVLILAMVATGRLSNGSYLGILRDSRGRYSLSQLQVLIWTAVLLSLVVGVFVGRVVGDATGGPLGFDIPNSVLALLGISVGSTVTARATKAGKNVRRPTRVAASGPEDPPRLGQVVLVEEGKLADKIVDVTKFQSLWITLILVAAYIAMAVTQIRKAASVSELTSLPDVAGTFVTFLAISHAGYLAGKLPDQAGVPDGKVLLDLTDPARAQEFRKQHPFTPRVKPATERSDEPVLGSTAGSINR